MNNNSNSFFCDCPRDHSGTRLDLTDLVYSLVKSLIFVFALAASIAIAAPAPPTGPGPGQRLAQINSQIGIVSGKINYPSNDQAKVEKAITKYHANNQKSLNSQLKRGLNQAGWARISASTAKSGSKLKRELAKLVQQEQQPYVDELVDLMGQGFVVRTRIQISQQRRQQSQNPQSQE